MNTAFSKDIDTSRLLHSEGFDEAYSRLYYAAMNNKFAVFFSPPGCGKSTLVRKLRDELDPRKTVFLYVSQSQLTPRWLYNELLTQLGGQTFYYRGDGRKALNQKFASIREIEGKNICICVDEAHLLSLETIQELRFFLNIDIDSRNLVSLILIGQDELKRKLYLDQFVAIRQRINIIVRLEPMNSDLTARYIETHLDYAAIDKNIFSQEATDAVYKYSHGVPRCVNTLCSLLLQLSAERGGEKIDSKTVAEVAENEILL